MSGRASGKGKSGNLEIGQQSSGSYGMSYLSDRYGSIIILFSPS